MIELFIRTFLFVLLCEIGSASNFVIASQASHSSSPYVIWGAGITALVITSAFAVLIGKYLVLLPVNPNLVSGIIMIVVGMVMLVNPS